MNFQFRLATQADALSIRELAEKTFRDTYTDFNTPENMELHVANNFNLEQIEKELQEADNQYFIVDLAGKIMAFAKLKKDHLTKGLTAKKAVEIERFYVDKTLQGQQIGRKLMNFCVEWAIQNNFEVIWLGVWENNANAIKFYQKMGFEFLEKHTFILGTEVQTDFTMKLDLKCCGEKKYKKGV
jgi:ribosomal protein S18 acetylase RimI-like enzyme